MGDKTRGVRNSALFGLSRFERKNGTYQNHSLIRNNWSSADKLRDAMGYVPVVISSSEGPKVLERAHAQSGIHTPFRATSGRMIQLGDATYQRYPTISNDELFGLVESGSTDKVLFHRNSWNSADISPGATTSPGKPMQGNVRSLLFKENENTDIQGVPYFSKYYHQDPGTDPFGLQPTEERMAGATEAVDPLMNRALAAGAIYDHYYK